MSRVSTPKSGSKAADEEGFDGEPAFHPASVDDWRAWLERNSGSATAVWAVLHHKGSRAPGVRYPEAIEHALCYGWVDSKAVKRDAESTYQRFSPRNPKSTWSGPNRERAERMISEGLMRPPGQAMIDLAKSAGTWDVLADARDGSMPRDLKHLFDQDQRALRNFEAFPPSSKRLILEWIASAKRPETRQRRIAQTVELAHDNVRANHPK